VETKNKLLFVLLFALFNVGLYYIFSVATFLLRWGLADSGQGKEWIDLVLVLVIPNIIGLSIGYYILSKKFGPKFALLTSIIYIVLFFLLITSPALIQTYQKTTITPEEVKARYLKFIQNNLDACYRLKNEECIQTWEEQKANMLRPDFVPDKDALFDHNL